MTKMLSSPIGGDDGRTPSIAPYMKSTEVVPWRRLHAVEIEIAPLPELHAGPVCVGLLGFAVFVLGKAVHTTPLSLLGWMICAAACAVNAAMSRATPKVPDAALHSVEVRHEALAIDSYVLSAALVTGVYESGDHVVLLIDGKETHFRPLDGADAAIEAIQNARALAQRATAIDVPEQPTPLGPYRSHALTASPAKSTLPEPLLAPEPLVLPSFIELPGFVRAALDKLVTGDHRVLMILREQLEFARLVERRDNENDVTFELYVPFNTDRVDEARPLRIGDVVARIDECDRPVPLALYVENGRMKRLVCRTNDLPVDATSYVLEYVEKEPSAVHQRWIVRL